MHQRRQEGLKQIMEKARLSSGEGYLLNMQMSLLGGGRARNYQWTMKHAHGEEEYLKQVRRGAESNLI